MDHGTQVIKVAGLQVHAVHDDGVPVTGEPQQFSQLRPGDVPAGGLVREDPVQDLAFELAFLVLVQCLKGTADGGKVSTVVDPSWELPACS